MKNKTFFFLFCLVIILGIIGVWYWQRNPFSKEDIKLEIIGPELIEMAEEADYIVKFKNNSQFTLEDIRLIFEYPENSLVENSLFVSKEIDDAYPGQEQSFSFVGRIFGKEKEPKVAKASVTYRPRNLKSFFENSTTFTTIVDFTPFSLEFDLPSKVEPDGNFAFDVNYFSNCSWPLSDLRVILDYPMGFEFLESKPKPLDQTEWEVGLLNKGEGGRITINGKLEGAMGEVKRFSAKLGIWQEGNLVILKESIKGIEIKEASLYVFQQINQLPQYIASSGEILQYEIFFKNIGEKTLENLLLVTELEGDVLDFDSIITETGRHREGEKKIYWDYTMLPKLKYLMSDEEGKVDFLVNVKENPPFEIINPIIRNQVSLGGVKEIFETRVNSKLEISQKGYFYTEVFSNFGPLPPRVGEMTTYAIFWEVKNVHNDLKNVKVRATLPSEVSLVDDFYPKDASFTFDQETKEVLWIIGDLERGTGVTSDPPFLYFQIALNPTTTQRNSTPLIISEARVTGEDIWTETVVSTTAQSIDTTLPDDPNVAGDMGVVQ